MTFMNLKPVVDFIVNLLIDIKKDDIYDSWKYRRKIKSVLKSDIKNINRIFLDVKIDDKMFDLINDFLIGTIFIDKSFYYPTELTAEQENKALEMFQERIKKSLGDSYVKPDYKKVIIKCINLHNKTVTDILMSFESTLQMNVMQMNYKSIEQELNKIFGALNTNTRIQNDDDELDFLVLQLESVMKSYMLDIKQLRKQEIFIFICLTIVILTICIVPTHFINYIENFISEIYICIIVMFFVTVVIYKLLKIFKKLNYLENKFEDHRRCLFAKHLYYYDGTLRKKFNDSIIDDFIDYN